MKLKESKRNILFLSLGAFFIANAIIAEFVGVKIFSLEKTFGFEPMNFMMFDEARSFDMTAGVLLWPMVFVMTDIINEYFGRHGVRLFTYIAVVLISYAFFAVFLSMQTTPSSFWVNKQLNNGLTIDMNQAFNNVFGQGLWIIIGSLIAFLIGQMVDVYIFQLIRKNTGEKHIWLRATGSTLISQFIDSFVVLFIAFYFSKLNTPDQWPFTRVLTIGAVNYVYKFVIAILLTPVLYLVHYLIDTYLGKELSDKMLTEAAAEW